MRRLPLLLQLASTLLAGLAGCGPAPAPPAYPNLLVAVIESLRADHVGALGFRAPGLERPTTPALDGLAARGVLYSRAYAPAPWAAGSVAGLVTGRLARHHGLGRLEDELAPGVETLAERLAREGYDCRAVVSDFLLGSGRGLDRGYAECSMSAARGAEFVSTEAVTDAAIEILRARADQEVPFFLFVHYGDPAPVLQRHPETNAAPLDGLEFKGGEALAYLKVLARDVTPAERAGLEALYEGEIHHADGGLGRLLAALDEFDQARDTVVVVTGTHGLELAERGRIGSGHSLHEELVRVPLVVHVPPELHGARSLPRGTRVDRPVSLCSVFPTALALLGLESERPYPSPALEELCAPHLPTTDAPASGVPGEGPHVLLEVDFETRDLSTATHCRALIGQRFKLLHDQFDGSLRRFDLELDPGELEDVGALHPEVRERMRAALERGPPPPEAARVTGDARCAPPGQGSESSGCPPRESRTR